MQRRRGFPARLGLIAALALVAFPRSVVAAGLDDPLQSAACRQALGTLQEREAEAASAALAAPGTRRPDAKPEPRLAAAQRQAAVACLATRADPPGAPARAASVPPAALAGRGLQPPIAVRSLAGSLPPAPRLPATRDATPVPQPSGPRFITACDTTGCWADDGSRLDRVGSTLQGRRGLCVVQGAAVSCP